MDSLANRYSSALLSIAEEENKIQDYQECCKVIRQCIKDNPDFLRVLLSSFVKYDDKIKVIHDVIDKFGLTHLTSFFCVILDNNRMHYIDSILLDFNSKCNEVLGVDEGIVYSVVKLDDKQIHDIEDSISIKLKRKVELRNEIDVRLLAGVKVVVNDRVFDGSVANKVENLKHSLIKGGK